MIELDGADKAGEALRDCGVQMFYRVLVCVSVSAHKYDTQSTHAHPFISYVCE